MANIAISDLNSSGLQLFSDNQSYLRELSETELTMTQGGSSLICIVSILYVAAATDYMDGSYYEIKGPQKL